MITIDIVKMMKSSFLQNEADFRSHFPLSLLSNAIIDFYVSKKLVVEK